MKRGKWFFLVALALLVLSSSVRSECKPVESFDDIAFGSTKTCTGTENTLPDDHSGQAHFPEGGKVTYRGQPYKMEPGGSISASEDGSVTVTGGKEFTTDQGTSVQDAESATVSPEAETIDRASRVSRDDLDLQESKNVELKPNGDFTADSAAVATAGRVTAREAVSVRRENGQLFVERAARIEILDGVLAEVESFIGNEIAFEIGSARDLVVGCVSIRGIEHSGVSITPDDVLIEAHSKDVDFMISDCGFEQSRFRGSSSAASVSIPRTRTGTYEIVDGELACYAPYSSDTLATETAASITYGDSCFSCMVLSPRSTYWHNAENLSDDFGLHIPESGSDYRACIRKKDEDDIADADGLIDLRKREIVAAGTANLLKYPFKRDQPAALLMNNLLEISNGFRVAWDIRDSRKTTVRISTEVDRGPGPDPTITAPNNYVTLQELPLYGVIHRLLRIDTKLPVSEPHQERVVRYESESAEAFIEIHRSELQQTGPSNVITVLPPEHAGILSIVN